VAVERQRRGPRDGNDRLARIARWIGQTLTPGLPQDCTLVLSCAPSAEADVVSRWEQSLACIELAHEINALITDYANDSGTTCNATLAWLRADGSGWSAKSFRATCDEQDRENIQPLDATVQSQITQLQRHCEAYAQQIAGMIDRSSSNQQRTDERFERVLGHYERMIDTLSARLDAAETQRMHALEREADALELAENAASAAEEADKRAAEAGQSDPLGQVIEIASRQLMGADKK
jgi:hypothetical protein